MTHNTGCILLAAEDRASRTFLADNLTADGFAVIAVDGRDSALAALEGETPALVVADINGDTLGLIDAVRGADGLASRIAADIPLIVLTAQGNELARIRYLDRGGDDVIHKPYTYLELRARIRAVLRRTSGPRPGRVLLVGELQIDTLSRDVRMAGTPVRLAAKEYELLVLMAGEPTRVFAKAELLREIWDCRWPCSTRTLDSHACRLRRKLADASGNGPRWMHNVWGVGYRLAPTGPREPDPVAA